MADASDPRFMGLPEAALRFCALLWVFLLGVFVLGAPSKRAVVARG
jgi:hypothetical protein